MIKQPSESSLGASHRPITSPRLRRGEGDRLAPANTVEPPQVAPASGSKMALISRSVPRWVFAIGLRATSPGCCGGGGILSLHPHRTAGARSPRPRERRGGHGHLVHPSNSRSIIVIKALSIIVITLSEVGDQQGMPVWAIVMGDPGGAVTL